MFHTIIPQCNQQSNSSASKENVDPGSIPEKQDHASKAVTYLPAGRTSTWSTQYLRLIQYAVI